jgi:hypothetical protein
MSEWFQMNRRLKKLDMDSVKEMLGRTSTPNVSCSAKLSISANHARFAMYDLKP